eukprot:1968305-Pyramimonas_sp.AAC.1
MHLKSVNNQARSPVISDWGRSGSSLAVTPARRLNRSSSVTLLGELRPLMNPVWARDPILWAAGEGAADGLVAGAFES